MIKHKCDSVKGSSGRSLLYILNYKVIEIHKGATQDKDKNYNRGTFLKIIIDSIKYDKKINKNMKIKLILMKKKKNKQKKMDFHY